MLYALYTMQTVCRYGFHTFVQYRLFYFINITNVFYNMYLAFKSNISIKKKKYKNNT